MSVKINKLGDDAGNYYSWLCSQYCDKETSTREKYTKLVSFGRSKGLVTNGDFWKLSNEEAISFKNQLIERFEPLRGKWLQKYQSQKGTR